jgi:hypothetical protein
MIVLLPNVLALNIFPNSVNVTKTPEGSQSFNIGVANLDAYTYYNVSIENNNILSSNTIPQINPGETFNLTLSTSYPNQITTVLRIKGFYNAAVGHYPQTFNVDVNAYTSNPCSFSIIKGDSVKFTSRLVNNINLRQYPSNSIVDGSTLTTNTSVTYTYSTPTVLSYQWFVGEWGFGQICQINVLDDIGMVNDPTRDGMLNFSLNIVYPSTIMQAVFPTTNYNLSIFSSDEGIISLTNIGNSTARNVKLTGEWFSFTPNNFDLEVGKTRTISYTIVPSISNTNQTNITHTKPVTVSGNFGSLVQNYNIFVNYADVNSNLTNSTNFLAWLCTNYPQLCEPQVKYVYVTNDSADTSFVPITSAQWRDYNLDQQNMKEDIKTVMNIIKEYIAFSTNKTQSLDNKLGTIELNNAEQLKVVKDSKDGTIIIITIVLIVIAIIAIVFLGLLIKHKNNVKDWERI